MSKLKIINLESVNDILLIITYLDGTETLTRVIPLFPESIKSITSEFANPEMLTYYIEYSQFITNQIKERYNFFKSNYKLSPNITTEFKLRPYQLDDVYRILATRSFCLFNDRRTGKTPTAAYAMRAMNEFYGYKKFVIIAPNSVIDDWQRMVRDVVGFSNTYISIGKSEYREHVNKMFMKSEFASVLICSASSLRNDNMSVFDLGIDYLVVDEGHFLRSDTKQTRLVKHLREKTKDILILTGTPVEKYDAEVVEIVYALYPYISMFNKGKKYNKVFYEFFFQKQTISELYSFNAKNSSSIVYTRILKNRKLAAAEVFSLISVQRKSSDIFDQVPEIPKNEHYLEMEESQVNTYFSNQSKVIAAYRANLAKARADNKEVSASVVLNTIIKLRQIALEPAIVTRNYNLDPNNASSKTKWVLDYLDDNPSDSVLIFSTSKIYVDILANIFSKYKNYKFGKITGDETTVEKNKARTLFQAGTLKILLITITAGGQSITLDKADVSIFVDRSYSTIQHEQAEGRMMHTQNYVDKTKRLKEIIYLNSKNTIDEKIAAVLKQKSSDTQITNHFREFLSELSDNYLVDSSESNIDDAMLSIDDEELLI